MKIAFMSAAYGNYSALEACLRDADSQRVEKKVFLGDAVGIGPQPAECIKAIKNEFDVVLYGDIDDAVWGNSKSADEIVQSSLKWTRKQLSRKDRSLTWRSDYECVFTNDEETEYIVAVHAAPDVLGQYGKKHTIFGRLLVPEMVNEDIIEKLPEDAMDRGRVFDIFCQLEVPLAVGGNIQYPYLVEALDHTSRRFPVFEPKPNQRNTTYKLDPKTTTFINVGSVGYPAKSWMASYVVVDTGTNESHFRRVPWETGRYKRLMEQNGKKELYAGSHVMQQFLLEQV